jgi:uracil phosphoribosyltransferase
MITNLSKKNSLLSNWVSELRSIEVQQDRMRFRKNLERIGEVMAYEISKELAYTQQETHTPLGISVDAILAQQPVLATILRAGLPLHQGFLNYFDKADNAYISAYRKHDAAGGFNINLEYISCPDLEGRTLILSDPMLATGASMVTTIRCLIQQGGVPNNIFVATVIACTIGVEYVKKEIPKAQIWCAAIDEELTAKSYIVPGLGDAGDLAFGPKVQL